LDAGQGTIPPSALIRKRSLSSIMTATSFGFAAVGSHLVSFTVFWELGSCHRDFWVESDPCRSSERDYKRSDSGGRFMLITKTGSKLRRYAYDFESKQKQLASGQ
jgi:hypothetical protein